MNKIELRKHLKTKVDSISVEDKKEASKLICQQLMSIASVSLAETIFTFLPLHDEVSLLPAIQLWIDESRTVGIPLMGWEDNSMRFGLLSNLSETSLLETRHGIKEPKERCPLPNEIIDVILVPGVGFDPIGGRLGRGGGFYDRFLEQSRPPVVIGVCFDEQITAKVPSEEHDQLMTAVVTPTKLLLM